MARRKRLDDRNCAEGERVLSYGSRHARNRGWWGYMKYIVRNYGNASPGEAITELERREREAVRRAVDETFRAGSGRLRIELIEMVYWRKSHQLQGAAMKLGISERTALRWHGDFIKTVAAEFFGDQTLKPAKHHVKEGEK